MVALLGRDLITCSAERAQTLTKAAREKRLELRDGSGKPRLDRHVPQRRHYEEERRKHGQKEIERQLRGKSGAIVLERVGKGPCELSPGQ